MKIQDKKIKAYALKNAIAHEGKANSGAIISALFHEGLKKEEIGEYIKKISEIIKEVNSLKIDEQEKEFEKLKEQVSERKERKGLPELPNVKKSGVVMRFAPSASGPLHVMHAIIAGFSYLYVKKYGGKFYVRIEDTNPENIYPPAYKMIENEAKWLFGDKVIITIQSDRIKTYYKYAEKLIRKNAAYVCTCSQEKFKEFSDSKKNCPCRSNSENLQRWKKMLDSKKGYGEGKAVLRFKSNMQDQNPAMRDFPLMRINLSKHPKQKNKYRVWPLMNLAVSVDDIEAKMTHIIRGKDHRDNAKRQEMIYTALGKKYPWCAFIGRVNFREMELSTSQTRKDIESGKYSGWDDSRIPFIESLKKRGYKPKAFLEMAEHFGISEVDKVIEEKEFFRLLNQFNKQSSE